MGGWPIPWIAVPYRLGMTYRTRRAKMLELGLCQVCGLGHEEGGEVLMLVNESRVPDGDPAGFEVLAMDDAIMHRRCYRLAVGRCPALRDLRRAGDLQAVVAPVEALSKFEDDQTGEPRWGAPLERCRLEPLP